MKRSGLFLLTFVSLFGYAQQDSSISTIDFVEILDNNTKEAHFYYQNNWKVLREMALEKGYIHSFQVLQTPFSEEAPFHMMLITTYANQEQYDTREDHFRELIKEYGALKLLNEKKPNAFRKTIFGKDGVRRWD